jgi:hypothetical protein
MGHNLDLYTFHTYRNRFCYEFTLTIGTYNRGNLDDPSSVQEFSDVPNIRDTLLSGISFSSPTAKPPSRENGVPTVTFFAASSPVAGTGVNSGITFTWTTRNIDYVQLHYSCRKGLIILDGMPECESYSSAQNYSPNLSGKIVFGNDIVDSPDRPSIPVTVTLVPFANGVANPKLSKSLTIAVSPYNAFPQGALTSNINMSIVLPASSNGEFSYLRGAATSIRWTDTLTKPPDPCVIYISFKTTAAEEKSTSTNYPSPVLLRAAAVPTRGLFRESSLDRDSEYWVRHRGSGHTP